MLFRGAGGGTPPRLRSCTRLCRLTLLFPGDSVHWPFWPSKQLYAREWGRMRHNNTQKDRGREKLVADQIECPVSCNIHTCFNFHVNCLGGQVEMFLIFILPKLQLDLVVKYYTSFGLGLEIVISAIVCYFLAWLITWWTKQCLFLFGVNS